MSQLSHALSLPGNICLLDGQSLYFLLVTSVKSAPREFQNSDRVQRASSVAYLREHIAAREKRKLFFTWLSRLDCEILAEGRWV